MPMFCPVWTVQYTDYLVLMEMEGADMPSYQVNDMPSWQSAIGSRRIALN